MRLISDFRLLERPPKPGPALFRWIAWRWCLFGLVFVLFVALFAVIHYLGGEPIYYVNEDRYLTDGEVSGMMAMFIFVGGLFFSLGLAGILFIPKS